MKTFNRVLFSQVMSDESGLEDPNFKQESSLGMEIDMVSDYVSSHNLSFEDDAPKRAELNVLSKTVDDFVNSSIGTQTRSFVNNLSTALAMKIDEDYKDFKEEINEVNAKTELIMNLSEKKLKAISEKYVLDDKMTDRFSDFSFECASFISPKIDCLEIVSELSGNEEREPNTLDLRKALNKLAFLNRKAKDCLIPDEDMEKFTNQFYDEEGNPTNSELTMEKARFYHVVSSIVDTKSFDFMIGEVQRLTSRFTLDSLKGVSHIGIEVKDCYSALKDAGSFFGLISEESEHMHERLTVANLLYTLCAYYLNLAKEKTKNVLLFDEETRNPVAYEVLQKEGGFDEDVLHYIYVKVVKGGFEFPIGGVKVTDVLNSKESNKVIYERDKVKRKTMKAKEELNCLHNSFSYILEKDLKECGNKEEREKRARLIKRIASRVRLNKISIEDGISQYLFSTKYKDDTIVPFMYTSYKTVLESLDTKKLTDEHLKIIDRSVVNDCVLEIISQTLK